MDNEEIIEQQNAYYMAGYPSRRSENKMDNVDLEQKKNSNYLNLFKVKIK